MPLYIDGIVYDELTQAEINALVSPPTGYTVFNTTEGRLEVNYGTPGVPDWNAASLTNEQADHLAVGGGNLVDQSINVVDNTAVPPTEVSGDIYILDNTGTSNAAWDGASAWDIVKFNGTTWDSFTPKEGYKSYIETLGVYYRFDGTSWVNDTPDADDIDDTSTTNKFVTAGDLTNLSNLSGINSGDQVASTVPYNNSTSGLTATTTQAAIDEVETRVDSNDAKVSADGSIDTHSDVDTTGKSAGDVLKWNDVSGQWEASTPTGGHDPLTLGGVANDTTDDTLDLTGQVLTVNLATQATDGALSAADKTKIDNLLSTKSGNVAVGTFTGNPKTAPVTFATAFPDSNYSIILTPEVDNANASYVLSYLNKTASGFTISTGTNSTANLLSVDWTAIYYGES